MPSSAPCALDRLPSRRPTARRRVAVQVAFPRATHAGRARARDGMRPGSTSGPTPSLAVTRPRPRRVAPSSVDALTPAEERVAVMAAEGATTRDIAEALCAAPKTIEVHL